MKFKITLLLLLVSFSILSQNITAKLIDTSTKQTIPYANIKTGAYAGVISNDEGFFTVAYKKDTKLISISCMGYENKTLTIAAIKKLNFIIELQQAINKLDEVFISTTAPNANTIIAKVKAKIVDNYNLDLQYYNVFKRSKYNADFKNLEFEIDKASDVKKKQLEGVNSSLHTLVNQVKNSNMVQFVDFKGAVYILNKDSIKLKIEKATELLDHKNDFSIDNIQEKMQNIILKYLDTTKTYKLKTGLFKIEDSLALNDDDFKDNGKNEFTVSYLNNETKYVLNRAQFYENSFLNKILDTDLYDYKFEDMTYNNGVLTYILTFYPRKGKAKYTGQLYIADNTYAITRVNYNYYKDRHGQKVNLRLLLGVKYIENKSKGTIIFEKDSSQRYYPKYIKNSTGNYFYVSRPLKFIENSSNKNKVSFDFTIEGENKNEFELLVTRHNTLSIADFEAETQAEKAPYIKLSKYEKSIWDNERILEPSLEMKTFETGE